MSRFSTNIILQLKNAPDHVRILKYLPKMLMKKKKKQYYEGIFTCHHSSPPTDMLHMSPRCDICSVDSVITNGEAGVVFKIFQK